MDRRRIAIVTDAWHPLINGVVRTLDTTTKLLRSRGHEVYILEPSSAWQVRVPFYPEIALALPRPGVVRDWLRRVAPDHLHISTEGPLGQWARHYARQQGDQFTTSYHTKFPEYLATLAGVPSGWSYRCLRWFHESATAMMVAVPSLEQELKSRGFRVPMRRWSRGVDRSIFRPRPRVATTDARPVLLYVGRVSAEKGLEDFLRLDIGGTKIIVGDGPQRAELQARYPQAKFLGYLKGDALGEVYAQADCFVFPSRTDTFGLVVIEAFAAGLPVAAYPVVGPGDLITRPELGAVHADLGQAIQQALAHGRREACLAEAEFYTWDRCTDQFLENLVPRRA